jgi:antitoxin component YwqK of YwqJK toxin-antitoxin module
MQQEFCPFHKLVAIAAQDGPITEVIERNDRVEFDKTYYVKCESPFDSPNKWPTEELGQKHGGYMTRFPNRSIACITNYRHDLEDGTRIEYYPSESIYLSDEERKFKGVKKISHFSHGVRNGEHTEYYDDDISTMKIKCNYENGVLNGECKLFHPNGVIMELRFYADGKLFGSKEMYNTNGMMMLRSWHENDETTFY